MNLGKNIMMIVSLMVAVILALAVLVPVIQDSSASEDTFSNTEYAYYQMKAFEVDDIWTYSSSVWSYDGDPITTSSQSNISVVVSNNTVIRQNAQLRSTEQVNSNAFASAEITEEGILMFNEDKPIPYDSGFGAVTNGDYVLKTYTDKAYVKGDTALWATGITNFEDGTPSSAMIVHIEGTIDDGLTITASPVKNGSTSNIVVGEYEIAYTPVSGYKDLYQIDNVTFTLNGDVTVDEDTTSKSVDATYSTFIIPKEITAERSTHVSTIEASLLNIIPLLVVIGIVIGAVWFIRQKN